MTPTSVLHVATGTRRHGGAERVLTGFLAALDPERISTRVVLFGAGDLDDYLRSCGHATVVVSIGAAFRPAARYGGSFEGARSAVRAMPRAVWAANRIRREAARFGADVIHTHGARGHLLLPALRATTSSSLVATIHDLPQGRLEARAMAAAVRGAHAVIATSHLVSRTFAGLGVQAQVIDNPVESPASRDRSEARARLGLPADAFIVASLGHFHWFKGQLDLIPAVARLGEGAHLAIAGGALYGRPSDQYLHELQEAANGSGAASRIHFLGLQDDVSWVYAASDVVAHCSVRPEPFGMVVVEAMLAGVPVVSSSAGSPGEMLDAGVTALVYQPGDVSSLVDRLASLRDDHVLAGRLARAGQAWASARFDPHRYAEAVTGIYEDLGHPPRRTGARISRPDG